jgi:hypothetical protein
MKNPPKRTIRKITTPPNPFSGIASYLAAMNRSETEEVEEHLPSDPVPFESVSVGDLLKPI